MIVTLLLAFTHLATAADLPSLSKTELTQKLERYQDIKAIEASFRQTKTIKDMDVVIKSEGHFSLTRPRKVRWEITKPSPVIISMDDNEVIIKTGSGVDSHSEKFKLNELPSGKMAQSLTGLMAWLDLNAAELYDHYEVYSEKTGQFRFVPKESGVIPFRNLTMFLDSNGYVQKILISENSNDSINIEFGTPKITSNKK